MPFPRPWEAGTTVLIQRPPVQSTVVIVDILGRDNVQRHPHVLPHGLLENDVAAERIDPFLALAFRLLADQKYLTSYISNDNLIEDLSKNTPQSWSR